MTRLKHPDPLSDHHRWCRQ